jgi:hypothetical protein
MRAQRFGHSNTGKEHDSTIKAAVLPSLIDLAWIAGFLEGEGSFQKNYGSGEVSTSQVQKEPLERLQCFLGGSISNGRRTSRSALVSYAWVTSGPCARGIMMTLYDFMSPRRKEQIRYSLGKSTQKEEEA